MLVIVPVFSFLCVLQVVKNIITRCNGDDYISSNLLTGNENEKLNEDMNETPEEIPEQVSHEENKNLKIRFGGVCPYCCGVLTRVYGKENKLKYVHCEYCGQVINER